MTHKSLAEALLAFQSEAPSLRKDATNPHYRSRYTPLDTVVETIQPLLTKHGLVWTALPGHDDHGPALNYRLIHATSGEELCGVMPLLLGKVDSQGMGSALTYARRYALSAVLNLVSDEDDDGNNASPRAVAAIRPVAEPAAATERPATAKQRGLLNGKAAEAGLSAEQFANAILSAAGQPGREFDSPEAAQQFVNRQLDRLPARMVDRVLAAFEAA